MTLVQRIGTAASAAVLAALVTAPAGAEGVAQPTPPASAAAPASAGPDDFVGKVRSAVANHDIEAFDKNLIDWDGARTRMHRLTLFQIRECFGRRVKSIGIEPLPKEEPGSPLIPQGYKTNLPVTNLLRIVFDEPDHAPGETPACVFMLSKDPATAYRIVLVLPTAPHPP